VTHTGAREHTSCWPARLPDPGARGIRYTQGAPLEKLRRFGGGRLCGACATKRTRAASDPNESRDSSPGLPEGCLSYPTAHPTPAH